MRVRSRLTQKRICSAAWDIVPTPVARSPCAGVATRCAGSVAGDRDFDHVAARQRHPFGRHRRAAAAEMPGGIGLAESAFGRRAIDRIDDEIAALRRGSTGAEADPLGRVTAEDHGLDAVALEPLVEIVAEKLVGAALFLIDDLARARRDALIDDLAAAWQGVGDE